MDEFRFCPYCGTKLLPPGARFCPSCGHSLVDGQGDADQDGDSRQGSRVSGTITDTLGRPLKAAQIEISGPSIAGERLHYTVASDADGKYDLLIARGVYKIHGTVTVRYQGKQWRLRLHPSDEDNDMVSAGSAPVVKDFQWRLTGLIPGDDPTSADSYYGGSLWIRCSNYDDRLRDTIVQGGADRFVCTFTFTPTGPRIDGSEGEVLTMTRTVESLWNTDIDVDLNASPYLFDIPLGQYLLSATLVWSDAPGQSAPVQLDVGAQGWRDSVAISFEPNGVSWGTKQDIVLIGLPH